MIVWFNYSLRYFGLVVEFASGSLKIINEAVNSVRKEEVTTHNILKGTKNIWLKNYNNLTQLSHIQKSNLTL